MARHLRVEFPGAIYHVTIRGNARQQIFADTQDRERFIHRLLESVETYRIRLYLFCLMNNHVHLLLETIDTNLSRFMQSLETGYTVYYNLRNRTVGHLFQGRYKAKLVEGNDYLLKLSRYIHLNPVVVGRAKGLPLRQRIKCLWNYRWSSYRSYIGADKPLKGVVYAPVLAQMGGKKGQWARRYRRFVENGLVKSDDDFLKIMEKSSHAIGSDEFCVWTHDLYQQMTEKNERPEDVAFRPQARRLPCEVILQVVCGQFSVEARELRQRRRGSLLRPVAVKMLSKYGGISNRAIAKIFGLKSAGTVTRQLRTATASATIGTNANAIIKKIEAEISRRITDLDASPSPIRYLKV